jgi:hypothetical protein
MTNLLLQKAKSGAIPLGNQEIQGRYKNKFAQGFLNGCGSSSQFQSVNSCLPILPLQSNDSREARWLSSTGVISGAPLLPSWGRQESFAPGQGLEAARSKITRTDDAAGRDALTDVVAPTTNAGKDVFQAGPAPSLNSGVGAVAGQGAPVSLTGGEGSNEKLLQERFTKAQQKKRR